MQQVLVMTDDDRFFITNQNELKAWLEFLSVKMVHSEFVPNGAKTISARLTENSIRVVWNTDDGLDVSKYQMTYVELVRILKKHS